MPEPDSPTAKPDAAHSVKPFIAPDRDLDPHTPFPWLRQAVGFHFHRTPAGRAALDVSGWPTLAEQERQAEGTR